MKTRLFCVLMLIGILGTTVLSSCASPSPSPSRAEQTRALLGEWQGGLEDALNGFSPSPDAGIIETIQDLREFIGIMENAIANSEAALDKYPAADPKLREHIRSALDYFRDAKEFEERLLSIVGDGAVGASVNLLEGLISGGGLLGWIPTLIKLGLNYGEITSGVQELESTREELHRDWEQLKRYLHETY